MAIKFAADAEDRKKLNQELRKAHFYLGYENTMPKTSVNSQKFQQYDLSACAQTNKDMLQLRDNLRSNHYILGTDDPKKNYTTTNHDSFKQPGPYERANLSQDTKNDLRSHHFIFGNDPINKQSNYHNNFTEKPIDKEVFQDRSQVGQFLRKHNHDFGDKKNYYSTMYNETLNNQYDKEFLKQGKSKQQIQDQIVELRKTNLVMGNNKLDYATQAMSEFTNRGNAKQRAMDIDVKSTNFCLGTDSNKFETTVKANFKGEFVPASTEQTKKLVEDLRHEHYKLGNDKPQMVSYYKNEYKEPSKEDLLNKPDMSHIYKTHFNLGGVTEDISANERYTSDYKNKFVKAENIIVGHARDDRMDRNSSIVLGSDKVNDRFVSEQMGNYQQQGERKPGFLDENLKNDLRTHHYAFGNDKPEYTTEFANTFNTGRPMGAKAALDPKLKKDLRCEHFKYGTAAMDYKSSQIEIGKSQGPPAKLDPVLAKDLRSHHFSNDQYKVDYSSVVQSTYKNWYKEAEAAQAATAAQQSQK